MIFPIIGILDNPLAPQNWGICKVSILFPKIGILDNHLAPQNWGICKVGILFPNFGILDNQPDCVTLSQKEYTTLFPENNQAEYVTLSQGIISLIM